MNYFPVGEKVKVNVKVDEENIKARGIGISYILSEISHCTDVVFFNNKIHTLGDSISGSDNNIMHYVYDGARRIKMQNCPSSVACAFILGDYLYMHSESGYIYKYNETNDTWTQVQRASNDYYSRDRGNAVINNEAHFFGEWFSNESIGHYKFDSNTVTKLKPVPIEIYYGIAEAFDGIIHLFCANSNGNLRYYLYHLDTDTYENLSSSVISSSSDLRLSTFVIADNMLHLYVNGRHYTWNSSSKTWEVAETDIKENVGMQYPRAVVHNGIVDIFTTKAHYKQILGKWYNSTATNTLIFPIS